MSDVAQVANVSLTRPEIPGKEMINKIGRMLENRGKITRDEFKAIIKVQNEQNLRFGDAALQLGFVNSDDIKAVLAEQFAYTVPPVESDFDLRLVAAFQPDSLQTEALRSLRSELLLRYFNRGDNLSLAIVGAEGPTAIALTASNLAITFAQLGIPTLLVDGNLRSPQIHKLFGHHERNAGLTDLIAERSEVHPTEIPNLGSLWVMSAGTEAPNPQELLASRHYSEKLLELTGRFEVTIISTPPLNNIKDAQLIAAQSGAALVVAHKDVSRMKDVETICTSLRGVGVRLLGAALQQ